MCRHWSRVLLRPRGPSLWSGLFCPGPSSLVGPIRPTHRHIAISPSLQLIRDAFAVRERLRRPASSSELSLAIPSRHAVPYVPGEIGIVLIPSTSDSNIGLHRDLSGSALPFILPSVSSRVRISELTGSHSLRPIRLLAPLTDLPGISPSHRSFYTQAFHDSVALLTAGYNYDSLGTSSVDGTFHRLE